VAVARHPGQAIPLEGSWFGEAKDYMGMSVNVAVHKVGEVADPSEEEKVAGWATCSAGQGIDGDLW